MNISQIQLYQADSDFVFFTQAAKSLHVELGYSLNKYKSKYRDKLVNVLPSARTNVILIIIFVTCLLRYRSNVDRFSRIELFPSIVLSSEKTNYKNDIQ